MRKINSKLLVTFAFISIIAAASVALAGDVDVRGNAPGDDSPVLDVQYTGGADDDIAVYGKCAPAAWWGVGGQFVGGWKGVEGYATMSGAGVRYGVYGIAGGGTSGHGVHGEGPVGVYGVAVGPDSWAAYFVGRTYSTGGYFPSDETLKTDIEDLNNSMEQVMQLKPKSFRYRTEDKENGKMNLPEGYHSGLIAQDLQEVFPELVKPVTLTEDNKDKSEPVATRTILAANYVELIPVLIKAIQEQQAQIADLQYQVASLTGKK